MTQDELKLVFDALEQCNTYAFAGGLGLRATAHRDALAILEKAIAKLESQEPVTRYCCHSCFKTSGGVMLDRMIVCPDCGNKRCPKASNHALKCTNSNDPNQVGSIYTHPPQRTWVGLTDEEMETTFLQCGGKWYGDFWKIEDADFHPFLRTIEAKLKEKNT